MDNLNSLNLDKSNPVVDSVSADTEDKVRFAGHTLLEQIGETGGMGIVNRALQHEPHRYVALKRIKRGIDASDEELQRFKAEIETIAKFDHPNIVQVFESGQHQGELYYSMPLIEGGSLQEKLRERSLLAPKTAAMIVRRVADAVMYAHQREVIHRDLKPANILFDEAGNPLVIDFGCAKLLDHEGTPTVHNGVLGTWSYMPPEQARSPESVDATADIFSLGAVLYECLVGRAPYQASNRLDTLKQLGDPRFEPPTPRDLNSSVSRDLEAICLKCISKEPSQRYQTAKALVADLDCFLAGIAPSVRPYTPARRMVAWYRRNPAVTGLTALSVLLCTGLIAVLILRNVHLRSAYEKINRLNNETLTSNASLEKANRGLEHERRIADESLYVNQIRAAHQSLRELRPSDARDVLNSLALMNSYSQHRQEWEWSYLSSLTDQSRKFRILQHDHEVKCVSVSPDAQRMLVGDTSGTLFEFELADVAKSTEISVRRLGHLIEPNDTAESELNLQEIRYGVDDRLVAVAAGRSGVFMLAFNRSEGDAVVAKTLWNFRTPIGSFVNRVRFSPSGASVVLATDDGLLVSLVAKTGKIISSVQSAHAGKPIVGLDSGMIDEVDSVVSGGADGKVNIWSIEDGVLQKRKALSTASSEVISVMICPDAGREIAAGTSSGEIYLWSIETNFQSSRMIPSGPDSIYALTYLSGGNQLVSAGQKDAIQIWNTGDFRLDGANTDDLNDQLLGVRVGHEGNVNDIASFTGHLRTAAETNVQSRPHDYRFVSVGQDQTVRLWSPMLASSQTLMAQGRTSVRSTALCFSHDGEILLTGNDDGEIRIWDVINRQLLYFFQGHDAAIKSIRAHPSTNRVASLDVDGNVLIWEAPAAKAEGTLNSQILTGVRAKSIAFFPGGNHFALRDQADSTQTKVYDLKTLEIDKEVQIKHQLLTDKELVEMYSAADSLIGVLSDGSMVDLLGKIDHLDFTSVPDWNSVEQPFAFSSSGRRVVKANGSDLEIWASLTGLSIMKLDAGDQILSLAISPDGQTVAAGIATGETSGEIRIWGARK